MHTQNLEYNYKNTKHIGFLAYDDNSKTPKPAVMIVHDWSGCNEFAKQKAKELASLGYVGFAVDMYGKGQIGESIEEKQALMKPLIENRRAIVGKLAECLNTLRSDPHVNPAKIAVIGFCFGGLCALDFARVGADVVGAISFHGLLNRPEDIEPKKIKAKILALHGYDDPMVPPKQLLAFYKEMTDAKANWQVDVYGNTKHAFMNPQAHDESLGTVYNAKTEKRATIAMYNFLKEVFA